MGTVRPMRTLSAGLSGLLAAMLLPVAMLSVWVEEVATDTDKYVDTVTPLADDDAVRTAAEQELEEAALQLVAIAQPALAKSGAVEGAVRLLVQTAVETDAFRTAWAQANRIAHEQLVAALEDRSPLVDDNGITIDLESVLDAVLLSMAGQGLVERESVPAVPVSFRVLDAEELARARDAYEGLRTVGFWAPVVWVGLVVLTLLLARRRLAATAKLATGSLLTLGVVALALALARPAVTDDLAEPEVARAVWDVVVRSLWLTVEISAVVLVLVAVVLGIAARGRPSGRFSPDGAISPD